MSLGPPVCPAPGGLAMSKVFVLLRRHGLAFPAVFLLLGGVAYGVTDQAASVGSATISACVAGQYHTLNVTTGARSCPDGQTKVSWNTAGPRGSQGPARHGRAHWPPRRRRSSRCNRSRRPSRSHRRNRRGRSCWAAGHHRRDRRRGASWPAGRHRQHRACRPGRAGPRPPHSLSSTH